MCAVTSLENRQLNRFASKKPGSLVVKLDYEHEQRFPCLITNASPAGLKLCVSVRLRSGQFVEVISKDDPFTALRCQGARRGRSKIAGLASVSYAFLLPSETLRDFVVEFFNFQSKLMLVRMLCVFVEK